MSLYSILYLSSFATYFLTILFRFHKLIYCLGISFDTLQVLMLGCLAISEHQLLWVLSSLSLHGLPNIFCLILCISMINTDQRYLNNFMLIFFSLIIRFLNAIISNKKYIYIHVLKCQIKNYASQPFYKLFVIKYLQT